MVWLVVGVILFWTAHLQKSVGRSIRARIIGRIGEDLYKGVIALSVLSAVGLMVVGWRATTPSWVYTPPAWGYWAALGGMFVSLSLFALAGGANAVTCRLRHPQLTGIATWAGAHLLANGDQRSLILFGSLGLWAIVEILAINQREGARERPEPQSITTVIGPLVGAAVAFAVLFWAHRWFTGMPLRFP